MRTSVTGSYTEGHKFWMVQICFGLWSALWHMRWRNLNTETEKSEQTVFGQISLSQY